MTTTKSENYQVNILQYPYQRDVANRLFLSTVSDSHLAVLHEIINGSLQDNISHLAENLELEQSAVESILVLFESLSLVKIDKKKYVVDKETRKCFEVELQKFSSRNEPSIQYLQELLSKVPIHLLPEWYEVPRSTNNIMSAIIERYFLSPKSYALHLEEMSRKLPEKYKVFLLLTQAPDCYLPAQTIMQKLNLSHEQFHRFALEMEFSFLACVCFKHTEHGREEGLAIFREWKEYNHFGNMTKYQPLATEHVHPLYKEDFGFLKNFNSLCEQKLDGDAGIAHHLFDDLSLTDKSDLTAWLRKSYVDQASRLYALLNRYNSKWSEKDVRELENALIAVSKKGWVLFDDFIRYSKALIRGKPQIELIMKGKKWHYLIPQYNEEDRELIKMIFRDLFAPVGMISIGTCQNQMCFCVTPYGRSVLAY